MKMYSERESRMRVKLSVIAVSAIMLMKKATGILKRTMFVAFVLAGCIGISTISWAGFSEADYRSVAENFLLYQNSSKQIISTDSVKDNDRIIGYIMGLEGGGYILIPATTILPPVKAYSLKSDFNSLPPAYKAFLIEELRVFQNEGRISTRDSEQTENNDSWNFLLSYKEMKVFPRYTPGDPPLLKTLWSQHYPYNKMLGIDGETAVVTGCTQTAWAQIMKYHKHPKTFKGFESYIWGGKVLTILPDKNYNWDNMPDVVNSFSPDVVNSSIPEFKQDEVALLMRDLVIINKAVFYTNVKLTGAGTNKGGIIEHFGYSTQMDSMSNDDPRFFSFLKDEIDNNRPVFLTLRLLELGWHAAVGDGYKEDPTGQSLHINMGMGGEDDFYYLNGTGTNDVFDTTKLTMTHHIMPCSSANNDCYKTETPDSINGSIGSGQYTISGQFNFDGDVDIYPVYLKGAASISGTRQGYSSKAFFISVYNSKREFVTSDDLPISSYQLPSDKYYVKISLKSETGSYIPYDSNYTPYTVNIATQSITDVEKAEIDSHAPLPVINNNFKMIGIKGAYQIRIDAENVNGEPVSLSATSSDENVITVNVDKEILTITPQVSSGYSEVTVKATTANGKAATKTFPVFVTDILFGKTFTISDTFTSQDDFNQHKVILDGSCTIGNIGYNGFFASVMNLIPMTSQGIQDTFSKNSYLIGASLQQNPGGLGSYYSYQAGINDSYTLTVSCPNADDSLATISNLLGIPITASRVINLNGNLAFGNVQINTTKTLTFTISNTGNSPLTISSITYPAGFIGNWNSGTIAAGGSQPVTVTFAPTAAQTYSGNITVNSDKTGGINTLPISGTGILQYTVTFQAGIGGTISGSTSQIMNQGGNCSTVTALANSGYQFVNWTGTDGFTSTSNPLTVSNVTANMTITANFQQIQNRIINLSGNLAFGNVNVGATKQLTFIITNPINSIFSGGPQNYPLTVSSITYPAGFTGNWNSGTIAAGSSQIVTVTFAPTAAQTYSGTVTVNSDKTSGTNTLAISGTGITNLISVSITQGPASMSENSYADYKATAAFSDGTTRDITTSAVWTENSAYASMDTTVRGRLKTATVSVKQTVTLTAKYTYNGTGKTASMPVTIIPKVLTSFTVTGGDSSVKGGSYSDYKATAVFDDGTTQDVTKLAVWTENSAYASMDYSVKGRMKTSVVRAEQKITLTARYTYKGVAKTASVPVTITVPPALSSLTITGSAIVNEKSYGDYTATATFEDGSSKDISSSATWTDNSAYAYMDSAKKGRLRTASVSSDQSVSITARYTFNGVTKTASFPVTIVNIP